MIVAMLDKAAVRKIAQWYADEVSKHLQPNYKAAERVRDGFQKYCLSRMGKGFERLSQNHQMEYCGSKFISFEPTGDDNSTLHILRRDDARG